MSMFSGKVAIITGSAQGLGKAFSRVLLEQGGKVCISDVNQKVLEKTYEEFKSEFADNLISQPCDVTDKVQLTEVFRRTREIYGGVDLVVNNAGIMDESLWEKCIDVNIKGVIQGTKLGLEHLRKDKGGRGGLILNIASLTGIFPVNSAPVYAASKHGIVGYTRSLAVHPDVVKNGVRLVCLCPAFVDTDIIKLDDGSRVEGLELAQMMIDKYGIMSVDQVTEVFVKAIEDTNNNGDSIIITMKGANNIPIPRP
uniref:15-hydroxyprostaglandin dehydrogenase [NAD(+)] n=1 Tax=Crassostrea virginica TaxID=6565 RepID=A0A8B8DR84_CRAVI|nr:15-hydroxyprostaglandin dehydrogenase [NAD(+)]-like [Crassostrea virginica]